MGKIIKKVLKALMWIMISFIVLLIAFFFIVQQSSVQTYLARKAAAYLSRQLETNVYIEKLTVVFPLDIDMQNFGIDDRTGQPILRSRAFQFSLGRLSLKERKIRIGRIALENTEINLITYAGDTVANFGFILDYFAGEESEPGESDPWSFRLLNASISNASFAMRDYNYDPEPVGMDFNHLLISELNLILSDLRFANDTLTTKIHYLSGVEQSGLALERLRTDFMLTPGGIFTKDMILRTPGSDLLLDLAFLFESFSDFNEFTEKIYIQADILPSELNINDIAFFAPDLLGMDNQIRIEGKVRGEVASLRLRDMAILYSDYTVFKGNISLDGLPDFAETFMHINVQEFKTHYRDLSAFKIPSENGPQVLELPDEVRKLGHLGIKGRFTGFYNDFVSDGTFFTEIGSITTDILLKYNFDTRDIVYSGTLNTRKFNLGHLLDENELLGFISMKASVKGTGQLPNTFDARFSAEIDSVDFMGNNLNKLIANGELSDKRFNGSLLLDDELISLDFRGLFDLNEDPPVFNFSAILEDAFLARLNLLERDQTSRLSTSMEFNFSGSSLDNLQGQIVLMDTWYYESGQDITMDNFELLAHPMDNGNRMLTLRSDYLDADFKGDFNYSQIYPAFQSILRYYLPSLDTDDEMTDDDIPDQSFTSVITLKNTQPISNLFMPDIVVTSGARIEGSFASREGIAEFRASAPEVSLFGTTVRNWNFTLDAQKENLKLQTGASQLLFKESSRSDTLELGIETLNIMAGFSGDTITYQIVWKEDELTRKNSGNLRGFLTFAESPLIEFRITESDMIVNGVPWWFNTDNRLIVDSTSLLVSNFIFESHGQKISLDGKISNDPVEKLNVHFHNWDLSNLDVLLIAYGIDISGAINGNVELIDIYNNFTFLADIVIDDFHVNHEKLGDLHLNTSWDPHSQSVWVDSYIQHTGSVGTILPFRLQGLYKPESETDNFDLELQLFNFRLDFTNPFLVDILSEIKGLASGEVKIKGTPDSPDIQGSISLMRTEFKVDFSNTYYSLADVIHLDKNRIYAENVTIHDRFGNTGIANLLFTHQNFDDWYMDLRVQANNLLGLQTTAIDNSLFYGTAFATGNFSMTGSFNDITMDLRARSGPQTYIAIPISFAVDVADSDFIIFTGADTETEEVIVDEQEPFSFRVNMDVDITRDAQLQIFLPYQMGNIRSNGNGNMKMHYNTTGDFTLFGDYVTNQGTFLFTLQNMINRTFVLQPGGLIRWSGDPYDADINMRAVYRTRVNLNSLPNISDQYLNRRFPVECILTLQNTLMNPEISFGIRMPNVDEEIQRQVFSAVDTTNEVVMSRQMISLLVLNSFNFSTDQANLASTLGASSFEMISNQLNSWLSQISKDFDIGINYRPGDQLSSEELELALSTQLFDDRVVIDGNIGMIGNEHSDQNASNIIGDINIEVKITRDGRFRVRAFNKYNTMEITRREAAPYTQGVGIFYRREFDRIQDLLRRSQRSVIEPDWPDSLNGNNGNGYNIKPPPDEG